VIACARTASRWAAASLVLALAPLRAQEPSPPRSAPTSRGVDVDSLVAEALRRSPAIAAQRERIAAAEQRTGAAAAFESPMLEAFLQNASIDDWTVGDEEMSMLGLEISQPLPLPGKRAARRRAAEADVEVANAELRALERRTAVAVRSGCAQLYALDRTVTTLGAARELLSLLAGTVATRYSTGEAGMEAQVEAQLAVSRVDERLATARADRHAAEAELNALLDRPAGSTFEVVENLPAAPVLPQGGTDLAARAPEARLREAAFAAAVQRVEAERQEQRADWVVAAGYATRGGFDPILSLRLSTELPLWGGGRASRRQAAEQDALAAQQAVRVAVVEAGAEAGRLQAEVERSATLLRLYRDAIVPQSGLAFEAARAGYVSGRGTFSGVVQELDRWFEARVELVQREAAYYVAATQLAALTSDAPLSMAPPPAPTPSPDRGGEGSR